MCHQSRKVLFLPFLLSRNSDLVHYWYPSIPERLHKASKILVGGPIVARVGCELLENPLFYAITAEAGRKEEWWNFSLFLSPT